MTERERAARLFFGKRFPGKKWEDSPAERAASESVVASKGIPWVVATCTGKPYAADWT